MAVSVVTPAKIRAVARSLADLRARGHRVVAIVSAMGRQPFDFAGGPGRTRTCNQTVMSGRISVSFVDFPVFLLDLIAFVVFRSGRFWCETGAVQRCSRRQTGNALRLLGEKRKSYTAVAAKRLLRLVKRGRSSQQPLRELRLGQRRVPARQSAPTRSDDLTVDSVL